jgi:hypothetical protein
MAIKLVKVRTATAGLAGAGISYHFLAPKGLYTGSVKTASGIEQLDTTDPTYDEPLFSIGELMKCRKIIRLHVRVLEGTKSRVAKMFCTPANLKDVEDLLRGKILTIDGAIVSGGTIKGLVGDRKTVLY